MPPHDIVVMGASAGGVEALARVAATLPGDLAAAVFVTVHFPPAATSVLPAILERAGPLRAVHAADRMPIERGTIYVAPPDRHLILTPIGIRVIRGPQENGNRPAIDPMFRSAAVSFGPRVIGVVLTGNLDDGTSGLLAIKRRRGIAVVQDPTEALFPSMPLSAGKYVDVDYTVPIARLGALLAELVGKGSASPSRVAERALETAAMDDRDREEVAYSALDLQVVEDPADHPGVVAPYSCPDCGGVLWQIEDGEMVRFRCRIGHAWSSDALVGRQVETLDAALWTALRALEESAALNRQMASRMRARELSAFANKFENEAQIAEHRARMIRDVLVSDRAPAVTDEPASGAMPATKPNRAVPPDASDPAARRAG